MHNDLFDLNQLSRSKNTKVVAIKGDNMLGYHIYATANRPYKFISYKIATTRIHQAKICNMLHCGYTCKPESLISLEDIIRRNVFSHVN